MFEFVVHHTSDNLIITYVLHSLGVKLNHVTLLVLVHDHPLFIEYSTAVLADGVAVSFIVHVVVDA